MLPERCPAYITQDRFAANQERLAANRARTSAAGAPRCGPSLLGGLLVCGRCGQRMTISYANGGQSLRQATQVPVRYLGLAAIGVAALLVAVVANVPRIKGV